MTSPEGSKEAVAVADIDERARKIGRKVVMRFWQNRRDHDYAGWVNAGEKDSDPEVRIAIAAAREALQEQADKLRVAGEALELARDYLMERKHGSHARSPGHNARLEVERALALLAAEPSPSGEAFQARVQPWMLACFGPEISADVTERNHRFLEEALELVQSTGCTQSEAHQLVDYVFARPVGETHQEIGGVMVTLAALCLAIGEDMAVAGETELARVWTKVDKIRAKQAAKPKHSPLPAEPSPASIETVTRDGWQPIETAPMDGSRFLALEGTRHFDCWWSDKGYGEAYWMDEADSEPEPTHWMPLPTPPTLKETSHGK